MRGNARVRAQIQREILDRADVAILKALQSDGRLTGAELAETVGLSGSQCARRRQRLEEAGVIAGYHASVDPAKAGMAIVAFVRITMAAHSHEATATFQRLVDTTPEILDAWMLSGEIDYLLHVAVENLTALHDFVQNVLLPHPIVGRVQSQLVLASMKSNGPLPISAI